VLTRARLWVRSIVLRRRLEREMQEEMAGHLEQATERLMARGLDPEEARREALREFGNVAYLQEEGRYARGTRALDALAGDVRFALRQFARRPGTTVVMLVVLAVGMSIATLLFSYVYAYAVQPPPGVALENDLVRIRGSQDVGADGRAPRPFSEEEFEGYRGLTKHFSSVAGWADEHVALDAPDDPEQSGLDAVAVFVTENYFSVLGVRPVLGRGLTAVDSEPGAAAVAVIGYTAWDRLYGRRPDVVGSTVRVNGVPVTVVGVAPERFYGMTGVAELKLWMPLETRALVTPGARGEKPGGLRAVGRLRPGVGTEAATAAARVVAARAGESDGKTPAAGPSRDAANPAARLSTDVVPLLSANGDPMFERDVRLMTFLVGLLGLLVLLVTCTNVSGLLTGLATARRHEIAVRLSLGAARGRLIRQLLTETALLSSVAAAAALAIVWAVLRIVTRLIPYLPLVLEINGPITLFTFGTALAVGILFGLSPALHATRLGLASALRDSSGTIAASRARLQRTLVVAQVAFTQPLVVLLAAVFLMVLHSFQPQGRTPHSDQLVRLTVLPRASFGASPAEQAATIRELRGSMDRLVHRLGGTPGVAGAHLEWRAEPALGAYGVHINDQVAGGAQSIVQLSAKRVSEGYFEMMGIPLLAGRGLEQRDAVPADSLNGEVPVVIGSELARRLWGGANPLGRRLRPASDTVRGRTLVVVGVVRAPEIGPGKVMRDARVFLAPDTSQLSTTVLLRTAGDAERHLPAIHQVLHEMAPGTRFRVETLASIEDEARRNFRLLAGGVSAAGLAALLLSAIGLYAVVAFSVSQRTSEIAVRIAVGARARQIAQRFVGDGLRLSALGLVMGLPVGLLAVRVLIASEDSIPDVSLPAITAITAVGVVLVAIAAAWIPARRAAAVDPATILRQE
jgi:predicted permease